MSGDGLPLPWLPPVPDPDGEAWTDKGDLKWSTPQDYSGHGGIPHGTLAGYRQGCRCLFCDHPAHRPETVTPDPPKAINTIVPKQLQRGSRACPSLPPAAPNTQQRNA